jgi:hypothetical protein
MAPRSISLAYAVQELLSEQQQPILAEKALYDLLAALYAGKYSARFALKVRKPEPSEADLNATIQRLRSARVIRPDPDFPGTHFQVFDVLEQSAESVCCLVDSTIYISHLSAMQIHGVTDRTPTQLSLTRPTASALGPEGELVVPPSLARRQRRSFPDNIRGRPILFHETRHPGYSGQMGAFSRVATIGQTFLDTVSHPAWCGGMLHVLSVWERETSFHLDEIIEAVDRYPIKLVKVRAGYILDEMLGISDERIFSWLRFAQRGSSQKLDPEKEYASTYSEKWMISLNV